MNRILQLLTILLTIGALTQVAIRATATNGRDAKPDGNGGVGPGP